MNSKILLSVASIAAAGALIIGATFAYFSDTETSNNNTFTAGSLDLTVDGNNGVNTVKFNLSNMKPLDSPIYPSYVIRNAGSVTGYLDLESISFVSDENSCIEPETEAGDTTCDNPGVGQGELGEAIHAQMWLDETCNGMDPSDTNVLPTDSLVNTVPSHFSTNYPLAAGDQVCFLSKFSYYGLPSSVDNKTMGDSMAFNMTFELAQTEAQ